MDTLYQDLIYFWLWLKIGRLCYQGNREGYFGSNRNTCPTCIRFPTVWNSTRLTPSSSICNYYIEKNTRPKLIFLQNLQKIIYYYRQNRMKKTESSIREYLFCRPSPQISNLESYFMTQNYEDYEPGAINPISSNDRNPSAQHILYDRITANHNTLKRLIEMIDDNKTPQINSPLSFNKNVSRKRSTDRSNKSKQPRERHQSKQDLIQIQFKLNQVMQLVNRKIEKNTQCYDQSTMKRVSDLKDIKNSLLYCTRQEKSKNNDINVQQTKDNYRGVTGVRQQQEFNLNCPEIQNYISVNPLFQPQKYVQKTQTIQSSKHVNIKKEYPLCSLPLEQSVFVRNIIPSQQPNLFCSPNNSNLNQQKYHSVPQCALKDRNIAHAIPNSNTFQMEIDTKTTLSNRATSSFPDRHQHNNLSNRPSTTTLNRSQSLPSHQQFHQSPLLVAPTAKASQGGQKIINSFVNPLISKMESQVRFPVPFLFIQENPHDIAYPKLSFKTKKKFSFNQYLHNNTNVIAPKDQDVSIIHKDENKIGLLSPPKPIIKSASTPQNPFIFFNSNQIKQNKIKQIDNKDSSMVQQNDLKKIVQIDQNNQNSVLKEIGYIDSDDSQILYYPRLPQSSQCSENNGRKLKKRGIQLTNRGYTSQHFNKS